MTTPPGGVNGAVQFNNNRRMGGDSEFTYSTTTKRVTVPGIEFSTAVINGVEYRFPTACAAGGFWRFDGLNITCETPTSVGVSTGTALVVTDGGVVISSPTSDINFNGTHFVVTLAGSTTAQVAINTSSFTALGPTIELNGSEVTGSLPAASIAAGSLGSGVIASSIAVNAVQDASIVSVSGSKVTGNISGNAAGITGTVNASQVVGIVGSSLKVQSSSGVVISTAMTQINVDTTTLTGTVVSGSTVVFSVNPDLRVSTFNVTGLSEGLPVYQGVDGLVTEAVDLENDVDGVLPVANGGIGDAGVVEEGALLVGTQGGVFESTVESTPMVRGLYYSNGNSLLSVISPNFSSLYIGHMPAVKSTWTATGAVIIGNEETAPLMHGGTTAGNVVIGAGALAAGTTLQNSVVIGAGALASFTTWEFGTTRPSVVIGASALTNISTGTGNTALGYSAGSTLIGSSDDNTFLGDSACGNFVEGDANICIGTRSGAGNGSSDYTHFGSNNIWVGQYTGGTDPAVTLNRTAAFGYGAHPRASDAFVIGPNLTEGSGLGYGNSGSYNVGIATDTPKERLHVAGDIWAESGVVTPGSFTLAQILAKTPDRAGEIVYCSNCATYTHCASTGTGVGAYTNPVNRGTVCQ